MPSEFFGKSVGVLIMLEHIFVIPARQFCGSMSILMWIRIRGSMPLTSGSGSGSLHLWQNTNFKKKFFCKILFEGTFTSFFWVKKSKRSHNKCFCRTQIGIPGTCWCRWPTAAHWSWRRWRSFSHGWKTHRSGWRCDVPCSTQPAAWGQHRSSRGRRFPRG